TGGELDSYSRKLFIDPTNTSVVYDLVCPGNNVIYNRLYKTIDGGGTWNLISGAFSAVADFAVGSGAIIVSTLDNIYKSTNVGSTWGTLSADPPPTSYVNLAVSPDLQTIYASTAGEIGGSIKSTDGGHTWSDLGLGSDYALTMDPTNPAVVYAIIAWGSGIIKKTTDGGAHWNKIYSNPIKIFPLTFATANPATLYFVDFGSNPNTLYKSTNAGNSWGPVNYGPYGMKYIGAIAINPVDTSTVYVGGYNNPGASEAFVTKLDPSGSTLLYSTYLVGPGDDHGTGLPVDSAGNAYITGDTTGNFPVTPGAYQTPLKGNPNVFVTKLSPAGTALVYSSSFGGSSGQTSGPGQVGNGIAVGSDGSAYVTGFTGSADFPTTPGAFQGTYGGGPSYYRDAFLTKLDPTGSKLSYSTFLGGKGDDWGTGIALDGAGTIYLTGSTGSTNFLTANAYQPQLKGYNNAFVFKWRET